MDREACPWGCKESDMTELSDFHFPFTMGEEKINQDVINLHFLDY